MQNIQKTVFKVSDFISWNRAKSLELSPAFQRRPVWPKGAKSLLIDTVVKGIPMPLIFLRAKVDPNSLEPLREVVDGQQRLRTIIAFLDPNSLKDYDEKRDKFTVEKTHNSALAGKNFNDLDANIRQKILDYDFSVQVLPVDTEDRDVLSIFSRMNATGYKLNEQELRNAEYHGPCKELMYQLAYEQLDRWRRWKIFTETDIARMIEVEETSDIVLTMINGIHGKKQTLIDEFYKNGNSTFKNGVEIAKRFRHTMEEIDDSVGRSLGDLVFHRRPLFHTLFAIVYDSIFDLKTPITSRTVKKHGVSRRMVSGIFRASLRIKMGNVDEDLAKILRGATGHYPARIARFRFLRDVIRDGARN